MSKKNFWNPIPLKNAILHAINKRQGVILDGDLFQLLQKNFKDVSPSELNRCLMDLEIEGIIHVSTITKTKRRVEIVKEGMGFLPVGED